MVLQFLFLIVNCYSYDIHKYLGDTICENLTQSQHKFLINFMGESCGNASVWADTVKREPGYTWTKEYHYINLLECRNNYTVNEISSSVEKNIFNGLTKFTKYIIGTDTSVDKKLNKIESLKMLFHLTQDLFQPLHIYGIYVGGNTFKIIRNKKGRNRSLNLHSFFDRDLPKTFVKTSNYTFTPNPDLEKIFKTKNFEHVLADIINKNVIRGCEIYKKIPESKYIIFEDFYDEIKMLFKQLFDDYITFSIYLFEIILQQLKEDFEGRSGSRNLNQIIRFQILELLPI